VRTPDKLRNLLKADYQLSETALETYLTIHQGNAKVILDVCKALINPVDNKLLVDTIWSSIGAYPKFQWSISMPFPLSEPTICEDGMATMFTAIDQLANRGIKTTRSNEKPLLIIVSATASENLWESLPLVYIPFYWWLLRSPQYDKMKMEKLVKGDGGVHTRGFVIIRPAIMTDGAERGLDKIRAGWRWGVADGAKTEQEPGYTTGWTVGKRDLGEWVFRKVIVEGGWEGRCVSLCY
jgi:hypothetical protein